MSELQVWVFIAGILWAVAAVVTIIGASGKIATACWYAGFALIAFGYSFNP